MALTHRPLRTSRSREHGAATVEFVLLLPIFLALIGTVIFAGWVGAVKAIIEHGASEGVRYAAVPASTDLRTYPNSAAVSAWVEDVTPLISPTSTQVLSGASGAARNAPVTVQVTYDFPNPAAALLSPLEVFGVDGPSDTFTLTATARARRE
jgi:Flp pilus assembly protein TadG